MIKLALILALAAIAGLILAGRAYSRRLDAGRTRAQQLDAAAIAAYRAAPVIVSLPPARTFAEITAEGLTEAERAADAAREAERAKLDALERWLGASESALLRAEALADQVVFAGIAKRAADSAELSAEAFARFMGYRGGVAEIRAAELIAEAHGDRGELVEKIQEAVPWDMAAELDAEPDLSDEALAAIVTAWAADVNA